MSTKGNNKSKKLKYYTNGVKTIRLKPTDEVPEGFYSGTHWKKVPWNKGLTKETDERVAKYVNARCETMKDRHIIPWNKGLTKEDPRVLRNTTKSAQTILERYGVSNMGALNPNPVWNKGLTKETDERMRKASENHKGCGSWCKGLKIKGHPQTEETKKKISKAHQSLELKQRRYNTMKKNNSWGKTVNSKAERVVYESLVKKYGEENIIQQYFDKLRYPYRCDFYVKTEDLFIEVNAHWTHGKEPYDCTKSEHQDLLLQWKSKDSKYYENAIYVWTDLDVRKQKCAKDNNLNYLALYNSDLINS